MANPLSNFNILVADSDLELARVLRVMLMEMGFEKIQTTRSGKDALSIIGEEPIDFLITEWNTQQLNGMDLVRSIRRDPGSTKPTLPVIMLTGRAEQTDVLTARDFGINEYVVKPFSPKSIFSRLERIIEKPRPFVVSKNFVGPSRRHNGPPPAHIAEQRKTVIIPSLQPQDTVGAIQSADTPKVWLPDYSLKYKIGKNVALQSIITPEVLGAAQAAIESISDESLQWVKDDIKAINELHNVLAAGYAPPSINNDIGTIALSINSRAGTFGYSRAGEIAYALYLFCRSTMQPTNKTHVTVVGKHIEVLKVILGNNMRGNAGSLGAQIAMELKHLVQINS